MLDNQPIAPLLPPAYVLAMTGNDLKSRILEVMKAQSVSKAELSRRSRVPYHALDKYLKGISLTTSFENGQALANALGIKMDGEAEYEELRRLFLSLPEQQRAFVLASVRGLLPDERQ